MAGTLLQGDTKEIIGGSAALFLAPASYPCPGEIGDIISLSTYAAAASYGFVPMGFTQEGITMARSVTTQETRTDEFGLLQTYPMDYKSVVSGIAKQASQENKIRLQQMVAGAANAAGELVTYGEAAPFLSTWRIAVVHEDEYHKFHCRLYPKGQWSGTAQQEMFRRGTNDQITFEFSCLPSQDAIGPNGQPSERLDFDQP